MNKLIKEYLELKTQIDSLQRKHDKIRKTLIELDNHETDDYILHIIYKENPRALNLNELRKKYGKDFIENNNLSKMRLLTRVEITVKDIKYRKIRE